MATSTKGQKAGGTATAQDKPDKTLKEELEAIGLKEEQDQVDLTLIRKLETIWNPHDEKSLPLRHEMGLLIVARMRELESDADRRHSLQKTAAERLGMSVSDLSRMRAFATRFPTFEEFVQKHPDVKVWSEVKGLLADLSAAEKPNRDDEDKPKKSTDKQREALVQKLTAVRQEISKVKDEFGAKQLKTVRIVVAELVDEIEDFVEPFRKPMKGKDG